MVVIFSGNKEEKNESKNFYYEGYLKEGTSWSDENGKMHYNSRRVKVEVWKQKIVTAEGNKLTQIYFLEGSNRGQFGYVKDSTLSR